MLKQPKLTKAAIVNIVRGKNPDHAYIVTRVESLPGESVTVSLHNWQDTVEPKIGIDIVLEGLESHVGGWRATKARRLTPEDKF